MNEVANHELKKELYSKQKGALLVKPLLAVGANGRSLGVLGWWSPKYNDASMVIELMKGSPATEEVQLGVRSPSRSLFLDLLGLSNDEAVRANTLGSRRPASIKKAVLLVDRGFRDCLPALKAAGIRVLHPCLAPKVSTSDANNYRCVTFARQVVERRFGALKLFKALRGRSSVASLQKRILTFELLLRIMDDHGTDMWPVGHTPDHIRARVDRMLKLKTAPNTVFSSVYARQTSSFREETIPAMSGSLVSSTWTVAQKHSYFEKFCNSGRAFAAAKDYLSEAERVGKCVLDRRLDAWSTTCLPDRYTPPYMLPVR